MTPEKVKIWHSLVTRFGLFFIALIMLAIFVSSLLVFRKASEVISDFNKIRLEHSSNLAKQSFYALLQEVSNDISILSENTHLENYVLSHSEDNKQEINHLFQITLKNKPSYFQVRLISLIEPGQEMIRYDKLNGEIIETSSDKLQNKSDRPYYYEASRMDKGAFYFSQISLNEEFGIISPEQIPTIRAAGLIYDKQNNALAMVVINVDLSPLYQELTQMMESGIGLMLVDEEDQFLFAPNQSKCFSKQLNTQESFSKDFGVKVNALSDSAGLAHRSYKNREGLFHVAPLQYSDNERIVYLVSTISEEMALQGVHETKVFSLWIMLAVSLVALVLAVIFTRAFARHIGDITLAISGFDKGQAPIHKIALSEERKDELGILARTFSKMRSKIDDQMEDLKTALNKEQMAIKERDVFLQNMSHELRTPLTAIMGMTQLLKKNNPTPQQGPIIDSIYRSTQSLAGLMYDVLDHQKLLEGQVHIQYKPINFYQQLQDIHASYQFEAANKKLTFTLEVEPDLQKNWYQSDPLRFSQIVTNLVVNAIKYTPNGSVQLTAKKTKENDQIMVSVSDTGLGIKPDNLNSIKTRFYRENLPALVSQDGFGLGLSIVKQLTDLFGGQLIIDSTYGKGSTFTISLPLIKTPNPVSVSDPKMEQVLAPNLRNLVSILHIEDDEHIRHLIYQLLDSPKIKLVQLSSLDIWQEKMKNIKPDLIISDLMIDSHVIDHELNELQNTYSCPLIIVSAFEATQMKVLSPYFLQKPFDINALSNMTLTLLGRQQFETPEMEPSYRQYDDQSDKISRFIQLLIEEFQTYLNRIENAFVSRDEKEWVAIRHKLITHIRSLSLDELGKLLPEQVHDLDEKTLIEIQNHIKYYLCFFKTESRLFQ